MKHIKENKMQRLSSFCGLKFCQVMGNLKWTIILRLGLLKSCMRGISEWGSRVRES